MARVYNITVSYHFAWWWKPYVLLLKAFVMTTGRPISTTHIEKAVHLAIRTEIATTPAEEA
ncbi:hypothetical protein ACTJK4_14095 [Ralstonia sp. 22111]|uniref:hypothetical protein n=1 Tax=Ralstonia sp. 22111 TaxID=3453878 RepID=UPI003F85F5DB